MESINFYPSKAFICYSHQVSTWFFTTFSVSGLKDKVHHIENLQQLFTCILPEQIDIPPFVLEYDTRVSIQSFHTHTPQSYPQKSFNTLQLSIEEGQLHLEKELCT